MYLEIWKIIIPIITFLIGVISTWWFKEREKKNQKIENAIKEISQLSTDWYHELFSIKQSFILNSPEDEINKQITIHSQNRTILPKLLQNIEILSGIKHCKDLVSEVNALLAIATVSSTNTKHQLLTTVELCRPILKSNKRIDEFLWEIPEHLCNYKLPQKLWTPNYNKDSEQLMETFLEVKMLVAMLDEKIQKINKLAGIALKKN